MLPQLHSVGYWDSSEIGMSGLKNMGNTCYMNSTVQCLSATAPFAAFFRDGSWMKAVNHVNPLGSKGQVAHAFSKLVRELWGMSSSFLTPTDFRKAITALASQFAGSEQHDSQEFLSFLMDGLHEDLNRVLHRPTVDRSPEEEAALEHLPPQIASHKEWAVYRMRNDSIVVDWFQGQFRNRLTCLTCSTTSTTYNAFMYLTLPVPSKMMGKLTLSQCLDAFVAEEVLEKSDAWFCPHCKQKRKARKQLTLSRLPPVLLIHLKRFSAKTHFTDKVDKLVDFPLRGLDLSSYVPSAVPQSSFSPPTGLPPEDRSDPRAQVPPFKYDLYAVTNHFGSLSSGHYTAFVKSGQEWRYCDDSRISRAEEKDVVVSLYFSLR
ncbi:cysteine proteinase [Peniophora sp. CONT]|nr:cysteine proteinase [Peniophora sp. CONT]